MGNIPKKAFPAKLISSLPMFDRSIGQDFRDRRDQKFDEFRDEIYLKKKKAFWEFYKTHMQSEYWKLIKQRRHIVDSFQCQNIIDDKICGKWAFHAHHLHYDNLGEEKLEDLSSVCVECHESIHGRSFDDKEV